MDKSKLIEKRSALADEYRKIVEGAKAEKRNLNADEVEKLDGMKAEIEQLNDQVKAFEKDEELRSFIKDVPVIEKADSKELKNAFEEIRSAMQEKRAITVNGTGAYNVVSEIVKVIQAKRPLVNMVRTFYGPNASTNIPVLNPSMAVPAYAAEGEPSVGSDSTAVLGVKSLTPYSFVSVLPVSSHALHMSGADLESDLPNIFADAFGRAIHAGILQGAGTTGNFTGLFLDGAIASANEIAVDAAGYPDMADLVELALKVQDYVDDGVIIMNPVFYSQIMADTTAGTDVYKEELARGKTIEGVKVILTSGAPTAYTSDATVAVAGPMSSYGLAIANELHIEPIKKVGDTNTYFQAEMFLNGSPIIDANFFCLKSAGTG